MKIGTPLSDNALKVMLLGGGELGKEIVISLQRLGIETIVVDRYDNTPASQVAHRSYTINMTDKNALLEVIKKESPKIIVPEIEAISIDALIEVEETNLARVVPNARAVSLAMNRKGIRELATNKLKLPTSKFRFANSFEDLEKKVVEIGYPCFIKPIMSSSGKGQSFVKSSSELKQAWDYAVNFGRVSNNEVIIEECIDFDTELTLLTVRYLNSNNEIETAFCNPIEHTQINGDYVTSFQPSLLFNETMAQAKSIAKAITDELGGLGIFGVELFKKENKIWFSEVSPRPHDTGLVTLVTQQMNEFDLHVRAFLGLPVHTEQNEMGASAVIYGGINGKGISYTSIERALAIPKTTIRLFGKPESFEKRRMGVALAYGEDIKDVINNAKLCATTIQTLEK